MTGVDTELLASVLRRAAERGATAADGFLVEDTSFSASVRLGQVDTVTHSREQRLSLRVFAGRASAAASICCRRLFASAPTALRDSGGSDRIDWRKAVTLPFGPTYSDRTVRRSSAVPAAAMRASACSPSALS